MFGIPNLNDFQSGLIPKYFRLQCRLKTDVYRYIFIPPPPTLKHKERLILKQEKEHINEPAAYHSKTNNIVEVEE